MTRIVETNSGLLFKIFVGYIFALVLLICCSNIVFSYKIEANSNILMVGDWDYRPWGENGQSRCMEMVDRALEFKVSRIQFVPTQFWVDEDGDKEIDHFCHKYSTSYCVPFNDTWIDYFRDDMKLCFGYAINNGLSISLSPHLDDGLELGGWRNTIPFDPLQPYGNYTYADILLYPLADAIAATAKLGTKVWFGLQGEMGATIMYNPQSYIQLYHELQNRILSNSSIDPHNLKIGLGFNFNKLCGCVLMDVVDTEEYLEKFPEAIAPILDQFDLTGLQNAFERFDFVGISGYSTLAPGFETPELQKAIYQFAQELKEFGVDLRGLMSKHGLEFHYSEYGIGGGAGQRGSATGTTQEEVAKTPFFGIFGPYNRQTDPWQMYSSTISPARQYMHYYYTQTIKMLGQDIYVNFDTDAENYRTEYVYNVDAVFIWNLASWDVQAIYPDSTTDQGSYRDEYVVQMIKDHNYNIRENFQPQF
eukprot:TRINITY_DN3511_c0_g2_i1.p1 TRINITY_DN3511_c0_g2~~TRINITY_DN3511_c0_g2_i1.p1  ORF type:complete len:548 (-),score=70.28 TRINITY_DN3511_c0_g2_i1:1419-2846(-)